MASATFTPRREFLKSGAAGSSFSLLSFAGPAFLRLSNFPSPSILAIRNALEPVRNFREDPDQNLCEITLEGKPWAVAKSVDSERLVVKIFSILFANNFVLLSPIDYGREPDDKLCLVFSRRNLPFPASVSQSSISNLATFAVSFPTTTSLRVLSAPLHATPAILQALRSAWPRGITNEKKIAESSYEFKLKGYSILREDTFPTDSLTHTLNLLHSLDSHGFSLAAAVSIAGTHHRVKDLWIFTGQDEGGSPTSDNTPPQVISNHGSAPPVIPPIIPTSPPHGLSPDAGQNATFPLWEQFASQEPSHGKSATAPAEYDRDRQHSVEATRDRVQSDTFSTAATVGSQSHVGTKPSVLRKKLPADKKDASISSARKERVILPLDRDPNAVQLSSSPVHLTDETTGRVLYSTPLQGSFPDESTLLNGKATEPQHRMDFVEQSPHKSTSDQHGTILEAAEMGALGPLAVHEFSHHATSSSTNEDAGMMKGPPKFDLSGQPPVEDEMFTEPPQHDRSELDHTSLVSAVDRAEDSQFAQYSAPSVAGEATTVPEHNVADISKLAESDPADAIPPSLDQTEQLLAPNVFRGSIFTESQPSNETTPAAASTLQYPPWSDQDMENPGKTGGMETTMENVTHSSQVTPKQPVISLPTEHQAAPTLSRGDTQMSTPFFPGGWAATPIEQNKQLVHDVDIKPTSMESSSPPQTEVISLDPARKSEFGMLGHVAFDSERPASTKELPSVSGAETLSNGQHVNHSEPIGGGMETHIPPRTILDMEEAKLPPTSDIAVDEPALDSGDAQAGLESNSPPLPELKATPVSAAASKSPSVLKRMFNRSSKRESKLSSQLNGTNSQAK